MQSTLPISRLVNVDVNLEPQAAQIQDISTLLILGASTVIDPVERYREYSTLTSVASDFGTLAPEYAAAVLWFEQRPQPDSLMIGRWVASAAPGQLKTATLSLTQRTISNWNAVTSGAFFVVIDGKPLAVTGLNFSSSSNLNGIASVLQTSLNLLSAGTTVVWNASFARFEFTSGTTGASSSFSLLKAPTAIGNFTFAAQPAANDKITLNGTDITFVSSAPSGNQVLIGASLAATLTNLVTFINASTDTQILKFKPYLVGTTLYVAATTPGAGGNALTISKTGTNITVSGATLAGATGTDISTSLLAGTAADSGAYTVTGQAAETPLDAVTVFDANFGQMWYATSFASSSITNNDHLACAAYIEGTNTKHVYGITTTESGTISSVSTTDVAYLVSQAKYNRTAVQYSSSNSYAVVSYLARILTTNYEANNTVITLMYKQEPGIVPEYLNETQVNVLATKNCNVFVAYNNNTAIIQNGVMASGEYTDTIMGTDWLALSIQNAVYNLLYTSTTKIPQTDPGVNIITTTIEATCYQGVVNGLMAPGIWNAGGFGSLSQGDYLPKGFYVYAPSVNSQSVADRAARKSPPIQVAAKLAGAIHTVDVLVNVNR